VWVVGLVGVFCGLVRGRPWSVDEERALRGLVSEGKSVPEIAGLLGKSHDGVEMKMYGLGLKLKQHKTKNKDKNGNGGVLASSVAVGRRVFSSEKLLLASELPNVEEVLRVLAAALLRSTEAGLSVDEIRRLQVVADLAVRYKKVFADYMDYRGIETRLEDIERRLGAQNQNEGRKED